MENYFFFLQTSWKDGLSQKFVMDYDLSCVIGTYDISFSRKYDLTPYAENETWYFSKKKKIHGNMIFPSNVPKRWYLQNGLRWGMIFLVLSGKIVFFPKNMVFFPWEKSEGRSFSRNTWKYEIFCGHVRVLQTWRCAPLSKKNKDNVTSQKYTRRWSTF